MDYMRKFDIELEKEYYYAGEKLKGWVIIENTDNLKVRGVRVFLRGKAHVEWKFTRGGERRTVKEDQYFMDEKAVVWGKEKSEDGMIPIMPRGNHKFPFEFPLPESALPCSFESRLGTIRYYLRVIIDIPYASPPQGLKYFTVIGPHIDCMDERYLAPVSAQEQSKRCCLCCVIGPVSLEATLERSAYCCGENIKLKCEIQNGSDQNVWVVCRLFQHLEYHINKGVLGLTKEVSHKIWEFKGPTVPPHKTQSFHDLHKYLQVPVTPPTLTDICKLIELYYVLKVSLGMEKSGEDIDMDFPIDVATVPYRITNGPSPELAYEIAAEYVEGGLYISPEFQLGQVYDGTLDTDEDIILYRPVYVCIPHDHISVTNMNNAHLSASSSPANATKDSHSNSSSVVAAPSHSNSHNSAVASASASASASVSTSAGPSASAPASASASASASVSGAVALTSADVARASAPTPASSSTVASAPTSTPAPASSSGNGTAAPGSGSGAVHSSSSFPPRAVAASMSSAGAGGGARPGAASPSSSEGGALPGAAQPTRAPAASSPGVAIQQKPERPKSSSSMDKGLTSEKCTSI